MKQLATIIIFLALQSLCTAVSAQSQNEPYVGRIIVDGKDICTGTLISPSIVLTAGHCVQPHGASSPIHLRRLNFLIKSPEDGRRRLFPAKDIALIPDFKYRSARTPELSELQSDLALIKLDGIATRKSFEKIGYPAESGTISYMPLSIGPDRAPRDLENCLTKILENDLVLLSCNRDEGFSGSPVFYNHNGERYILGVVTAKSLRSGIRVLYATIPRRKITKMIWQNDLGTYQINRTLSD